MFCHRWVSPGKLQLRMAYLIWTHNDISLLSSQLCLCCTFTTGFLQILMQYFQVPIHYAQVPIHYIRVSLHYFQLTIDKVQVSTHLWKDHIHFECTSFYFLRVDDLILLSNLQAAEMAVQIAKTQADGQLSTKEILHQSDGQDLRLSGWCRLTGRLIWGKCFQFYRRHKAASWDPQVSIVEPNKQRGVACW